MPSSPTYKNIDALIEQPESGSLRFDTRRVVTKVYVGKRADCIADALPSGAEGSGDLAGYIVEQSEVSPFRGGLARLTISWQANSVEGLVPLPPDEVAVQPDNLSPRTELHPLYLPLDNRQIAVPGGDTEYVLDVVYAAAHAQSYADRKTQTDKLVGDPLALNLLSKIRRGNESYYMAALRYVWATHSYSRPTMYRGGRQEEPGGPLQGYFVSNISWLRESDDLQYSQGIWRLTRSWIGGPDGHWDIDLYG